MKDRAQRFAHADLHPDQKLSKRRGVASNTVTNSKTRSRDRIDRLSLPIGLQKQLLILHADNDFMMGIPGSDGEQRGGHPPLRTKGGYQSKKQE